MKYLLILIILFSNSVAMVAQSRLDSLLGDALIMIDKGQYLDAIQIYNECLEIDPSASGVHFELVNLYSEIGNFKLAIAHCDSIISIGTDFLLKAYIIKGTLLNDLGKFKESQEVSEQAIKLFDGNYQLYYNLGASFYKLKKHLDAERNIQKAIKLNPTHASSHLLLGFTNIEKSKVTSGLLCLYYFLLLEPNTTRSEEAIRLVRNNTTQYTVVDDDVRDAIVISPNQDGGFSTKSLVTALTKAGELMIANEYGSGVEVYKYQTSSFIEEIVNAQKYIKEKDRSDFYVSTYCDLFVDIYEDDLEEVFSFYTSQCKYPESKQWVAENEEKLKKFGEWLKQRED